MNFSQHARIFSALLILAVSVTSVQAQTVKVPYYQTISIDAVLKTKPAVIYVSPKYQVTIKINGREITGVSLELSKQKLFSVTLAENRRMIFLDAMSAKGGADLNLILDDEEVLPVHLIVKDQPSGTRIYTFEGGQPSGGEEEVEAAPASSAAPAAPARVTPPVRAPTPPAGTGAAPDTRTPQAAFTSTTSTLTALPAQPLRDARASARMDVKVARMGADATLTLRLTSPAGQALRADLNSLRLYDGTKAVSYVIQKTPRGRLLPVEVTVKVTNAPKALLVSWPVTGIYPAGQYTLNTPVQVN
ncbi:hypothetical protein [Deinococcus humi]|uniref:AMIN domain-containing protein n=1 Tax=Deinococcus humi TaxID=662880 RepID=A0A7W8K2T6_9DEIO|nr:hypothetical protein [Deinococcus humi]MBB5366249.1 hypothetical protein [Deinococcus humi]